MKESASLSSLVFLTQTDTTIGFVSQSAKRLTAIKQRPPYKHYIKAVDSLQTLNRFTRIPKLHRKRVRRTRRTTFIMPGGDSYRVVYDPHHLLLLRRLKWAYTTSANRSGEPYDETFAIQQADVVVAPLGKTQKPSTIYRLGKTKLQRIRP